MDNLHIFMGLKMLANILAEKYYPTVLVQYSSDRKYLTFNS